MKKFEEIIEHFNMDPHPEGGFSKLLFEDSEIIQEKCLPNNYQGSRPLWNAIYYLLPKGSKSIFHKLKMSEMWNFYLGGSLELYDLAPNGDLKKTILGNNIFHDEKLSYVFPKDHWIAAKPTKNSSFCLVSCITSPGFTFQDWEKGNREKMIKLYPSHKDTIIELT